MLDVKYQAPAVHVRSVSQGKARASGGYRVITFYSGEDIPVFLLNVIAKNERTDLAQAERNQLKTVLRELADAYRGRT